MYTPLDYIAYKQLITTWLPCLCLHEFPNQYARQSLCSFSVPCVTCRQNVHTYMQWLLNKAFSTWICCWRGAVV